MKDPRILNIINLFYLISPSKLPDKKLVIIVGDLDSATTPSEWPVRAPKNGLANILSIFVETKALWYSLG